MPAEVFLLVAPHSLSNPDSMLESLFVVRSTGFLLVADGPHLNLYLF
jgi:hypothetical protein